VAAVVAYFPPTDLDVLLRGRARQGAIDFDESLRAPNSPIHFVDARDPPTLIISGGADRGVPIAQSEMMKASLDKAGVLNALKVFPDADHDFYVKGDPAKTDAYAIDAMNSMVAWFEQRLN
jgi:dipeptidyl aminopeptidase/acylaminoacyl peptidase